jgi:hypothetical protein
MGSIATGLLIAAHMDWGTDFVAWANKVERPFRED